ncbi:glycoside hydrolase family 19 protein [Francisella philomiragia]|uniref:chitinase n=1 Tax=Francisella philomiragia TaxID=28110 RepID=UPI002277CA33|nr:glycoside hydrolase family 19 protein [Francisella philomiragia]
MNNKIKILSAFTLTLMGSLAFANCKLDDVQKGWTGKITFSCDKNTNLEENPISFKLSNGVEVGSIWGIGNATMTQSNGGVISITSKQWSGQPTIVTAGSTASFSFSPSAPVFSVESFSVGNGGSDDPVDPTDPEDPIDPVDPVDPVDPIDPPSGDYQSYVAGTKYESGTIVSADGKLYKCKAGVAAWCSSAAGWAYAPGSGTAWETAWDLYDPSNPDEPVDPTDPTDPDEPTSDNYVTTQAKLDAKEAELTSGTVLSQVKESIKTRDNSVVEAVTAGNPNNPDNVKRVEKIFTEVAIKDNAIETKSAEGVWNYMFPERSPEYTYENFLKAVAKFPAFCGTYTDGRDSDAICRKSLATMFAHFTQETGGHTSWWDVPEWRQGLVHVREMGWDENMRGGYNGECNPDVWQGQTWPCGKFENGDFKSYFGRGAKQLSYNYNYGPFSQAMFGDVRVLLDNPDMVADTWLNLASAVFFFVYPQPPKPSMLHVIDGTWQPNAADKANNLTPGFGVTTQIINGGVECGGSVEVAQSMNRIDYYGNFMNYLGLNIPSTEVLGCKGMKQFDANGAGATQIYWEKDSSWIASNPNGEAFACKLVGYQTPYSAFTEGDYTKCVKAHFPNIVIEG